MKARVRITQPGVTYVITLILHIYVVRVHRVAHLTPFRKKLYTDILTYTNKTTYVIIKSIIRGLYITILYMGCYGYKFIHVQHELNQMDHTFPNKTLCEQTISKTKK